LRISQGCQRETLDTSALLEFELTREAALLLLLSSLGAVRSRSLLALYL
jgi:hypothetical protein